MAELNAWIARALLESRELQNQAWTRKNTCILAAGINHEVLDYFQIPHRIVAVDCWAFNPTATVLLKEDKLPDNGTIVDGEEAWTVAIDKTRHVVVVTNTHLIDTAADGFDRPQRKLLIGPFIGLLPQNFVERKHTCSWDVDECRIEYRLRPDQNQWWKGSPNWRYRKENPSKEIIGRTIRLAKEYMTLE